MATRLRPWIDLAKLRLNSLVLFAVGGTYFVASANGVDWVRMVLTVLGAGCVAAGSSALNMVLERRYDALMDRTHDRPLPTGVLAPGPAVAYGVGLAIAGVVILALGVNLVAAAVSVATLVAYLFLYTPLKRYTTLNTIVGAVPGALPVVLGWAGARGIVEKPAWALFGIVFLWQIPHFLAIAKLYRDDYARGGFRMLPNVDPDGVMIARQVILYALALLPVSLLPAMYAISGTRYFGAAVFLGLLMIGFTIDVAVERGRASARRLFLFTLVYLPAIWIMLMIDRRPYLPV